MPSLLASNLPLGILPLGTANDFARTIGIPENLSDACVTISDGAIRELDVGSVNGNYFLNNAAIGLPAEVAARTNPALKQRFGIFAHMIAALPVLVKMHAFTAQLQTQDQMETVRLSAPLLGNGKYEGGFPIRYKAVNDGLLNVTQCLAKTLDDSARLLWAVVTKRLPECGAFRQFDTSRLEIRTTSPKRVCTDGDVTTQTPANFQIHHDALRVFAP